jgi:hypothetical protein
MRKVFTSLQPRGYTHYNYSEVVWEQEWETRGLKPTSEFLYAEANNIQLKIIVPNHFKALLKLKQNYI